MSGLWKGGGRLQMNASHLTYFWQNTYLSNAHGRNFINDNSLIIQNKTTTNNIVLRRCIQNWVSLLHSALNMAEIVSAIISNIHYTVPHTNGVQAATFLSCPVEYCPAQLPRLSMLYLASILQLNCPGGGWRRSPVRWRWNYLTGTRKKQQWMQSLLRMRCVLTIWFCTVCMWHDTYVCTCGATVVFIGYHTMHLNERIPGAQSAQGAFILQWSTHW